MLNADLAVIEGFGLEWACFDQSELCESDQEQGFAEYFSLVPWARLPINAVAADIGCGSGRWAFMVAPRVGQLLCFDPSREALAVARANLAERPNVVCLEAEAEDLPVPDGSLDFAYCLGVLHHIPDTAGALKACVAKLKPGAPFLLYVYYAFDDRSARYRAVWRASDILRRLTCRMPHPMRYLVSQAVAALAYLPLATAARLAERAGLDVVRWPLSYYRTRSFYTMRTDALDRLGTRLEQRFTRHQVEAMMAAAGLSDVRFSDRQPGWVAIGTKA